MSATARCSNAAAKVDLPDDGWPSKSTCFDGIDRVDDTESKMDDQRSCGGGEGVEVRDIKMVQSQSKKMDTQLLLAQALDQSPACPLRSQNQQSPYQITNYQNRRLLGL